MAAVLDTGISNSISICSGFFVLDINVLLQEIVLSVYHLLVN